MTNLWDKYARPPKEVLKEFRRPGGFKGTSIDPMWFYKCATEEWGEYGPDWNVTILSESVEKFDDGQVLHYMMVSVRDALGVGCTMMRVQRNSGDWFVDEEAPKKSFTDAVTNALSKKGFGHAIYMGQWDGSKYTGDAPKSPTRSTTDDPSQTRPGENWDGKTPPDIKAEVSAPLEIPVSWPAKAQDMYRELFNRGTDVIDRAGGDSFKVRALRVITHGFDALSLSELSDDDARTVYDRVEEMINNVADKTGEQE